MGATEHNSDELVHEPVPGYPAAFYVVCALCFVWLIVLFMNANNQTAQQGGHSQAQEEHHVMPEQHSEEVTEAAVVTSDMNTEHEEHGKEEYR